MGLEWWIMQNISKKYICCHFSWDNIQSAPLVRFIKSKSWLNVFFSDFSVLSLITHHLAGAVRGDFDNFWN